MKNKRVKIGLGMLLLLAAGVLVFLVSTRKGSQPLHIETAAVKPGNINRVVTATGTIEPIKQVSIGTQVSGVVQKIYADYNSTVKAGQLIAELDKTNLIASMSEAKASYNTAVNQMDYLQKTFTRQETLYKDKVISEADYDEALYKLNDAKGTVEQRKSDLNRAATNLGYADIYSPIDGVVLSKAVDVGQTVAASFSTPTLFTIAQDLSEMQVEANVDEADIGNVTEGQRVTFTVDAFPGEEFSGKVTQVRLNGTVKSNVVTYTVVIQAENPAKKLKPGLTATISIYTLELKNILTVDAKVFEFDPDPQMIMQYNLQQHIPGPPPAAHPDSSHSRPRPDNGKVKTVWISGSQGLHPQPIVVGSNDRISYQVLEGLKAGDLVVTGISATAAEKTDSQATTAGNSPFMPPPPGKKK